MVKFLFYAFQSMLRNMSCTVGIFCEEEFTPANGFRLISKLLGPSKDEAVEILTVITNGRKTWADYNWNFLSLFEKDLVDFRLFIETCANNNPKRRRLLLESVSEYIDIYISEYEGDSRDWIEENIPVEMPVSTAPIYNGPEAWRASACLAALKIDNLPLQHQLCKLENNPSLFRILPKFKWPNFLIHLGAKGVEPLLVTDALIKANLIE